MDWTINDHKTVNLNTVLVAILLALLVYVSFYPGLFSNDSFSHLEQAKTGVYFTWHSVSLSAIWHFLYPYFAEGSILLLHQIAYWIAIALVISILTNKYKFKFFLLGFIPPILMLSITIWKDFSLLLSLSYLVIGFIFFIRSKKFIWLLICFLASVLGVSFKHNTILFIWVLWMGFAFIYFSRNKKLSTALYYSIALTVALAIGSIFIQSMFIKAINATPSRPLQSVLLWDISGIKYRIRDFDAPLPSYVHPNDTIEAKNWVRYYENDLDSICWNAHLNCESKSFEEDKALILDWINTIRDHPVEYLSHRFYIAKKLLGTSYFPYHSYAQNATSGPDFAFSKIGVRLVNFLAQINNWLLKVHLYQAGIWMLFSFIYLCFFFWKLKRQSRFVDYELILFVCVCSSIFSYVSLIFIAPSTDWRYMSWSILVGYCSCGVLIFKTLQLCPSLKKIIKPINYS